MNTIEKKLYLKFYKISLEFHLNCFSIKEDTKDNAFDHQSSSLIKLNNGTILYLREVDKFLALVCILREDNFDKQGKFSDRKICGNK